MQMPYFSIVFISIKVLQLLKNLRFNKNTVLSLKKQVLM
ncbi:MAG: hypothetical protein QG594_2454 [Bacteroidota bacterium]|nr:hypothetical protein [Bacteroidota bacterium]